MNADVNLDLAVVQLVLCGTRQNQVWSESFVMAYATYVNTISPENGGLKVSFPSMFPPRENVLAVHVEKKENN